MEDESGAIDPTKHDQKVYVEELVNLPVKIVGTLVKKMSLTKPFIVNNLCCYREGRFSNAY